MATPIGSILKRACRNPDDPYNILTFVTHERYQSNLANCNANFYLLQNGPGIKGDWKTSYAPIPDNHIILSTYQDNPLEVIPSYIDFDFILGQHKFGQAQTALQLGSYLNIPTVILEHTVPTNKSLQDNLENLKNIKGDINIFISDYSRDQWGWKDDEAEVILHGVNTKLFRKIPNVKKEQKVLSIVNDWINRSDILGYDIWERVAKNNFQCSVWGDTPGLSRSTNNIYELVKTYNENTVFFNTSRLSPVPSVLLEAMACELPVVSTDNCLISEIIENGVNGYKTNNEKEMNDHIYRLLNDEEERKEIGANARKTILEKFNLDRFVQDWNNIFDRMDKIIK